MKLYLVQHAKAASKEVDPERPLTEEGHRDIQKVAAFIRPLNLCVDYCGTAARNVLPRQPSFWPKLSR